MIEEFDKNSEFHMILADRTLRDCSEKLVAIVWSTSYTLPTHLFHGLVIIQRIKGLATYKFSVDALHKGEFKLTLFGRCVNVFSDYFDD
jgi:hypothetical protein